MLRVKGAEEARTVAQWLADSPRRDRFDGLLEAGGFRATGFFRTEPRNGRWWLVTPEGNAFFSIGMDVIALTGETYVDGREFMFRDLPAPNGTPGCVRAPPGDRRRSTDTAPNRCPALLRVYVTGERGGCGQEVRKTSVSRNAVRSPQTFNFPSIKKAQPEFAKSHLE
jgi:hypothetical protein